ncbi:DNA alkylation repair protein [Psychromonas sp. Urea-02u-13]|uniref:DNA alkylation repair protein n=1 Tax=Psychromonas sp. Urea-02u-13 TaxID=2058326 RepID=UPI000C3362F4|nr:DNA alkylation repair protein [Psychromonas sp. Urea-02u-13]PKG40301.1 DNA alkylation repair protein [Psychromonas sp. Urea-02u-13]
MAELLKDVYNHAFIDSVATHFQDAYPGFEKQLFITTIFDSQWASRELKSRLTFITQTLHHLLPSDFKKSTTILKKVAPFFSSYEAMFFPAFIELYGLDDYETSVECLAFLTQYSSSEFAVRPFIEKYPEKMMAQMLEWSESDNFHIRRLASEGCRPRLPWASALPLFKADPTAIIPILECLKDDDEDYVYRSVANNLNDISKDNPELVVKIAQSWMQGKPTKNRRWLVKHACRGLLKSANVDILALFGFTHPRHINIEKFTLDKTVKWGEKLNFSFTLSASQALGKCRCEFIIAFMKKNGKQADKIFKISESEINAHQKEITKQFSFKAISTRQYYPGEHKLMLIVNGVQMAQLPFTLQP